MTQRRTRPWAFPIVNLVGTIALGVAINFATDLKTSWVAWIAVAALGLTIAGVTAVLAGDGPVRDSTRGIATEHNSKTSRSSTTTGLVMRTTEAQSPDGSSRTVVEFFSEEVAIQVFRENFKHDGPS